MIGPPPALNTLLLLLALVVLPIRPPLPDVELSGPLPQALPGFVRGDGDPTRAIAPLPAPAVAEAAPAAPAPPPPPPPPPRPLCCRWNDAEAPPPAKAKLPVLWNVPFVMALRVGVDGPKSIDPVPLLLPLMLPLPPPPLPFLPATPPRRDSCGEYVGASALWRQSEK